MIAELQQKVREFVNEHVQCDLSNWVYFAQQIWPELTRQQKDDCPIDLDDCIPMVGCISSTLFPDEDEYLEQGDLIDLLDDIDNQIKYFDGSDEDLEILYKKKWNLEEALDDLQPLDIYEWHQVSWYLGRRLKDKGEVVIDNTIWGRQCTGQAILLDSVINEIYLECE